MSQVKKQLDQQGIKQLVKDLIEYGYLTNKAEIGVAKKFAEDGEDSLSEKQKEVYEKYVKSYVMRICARCGDSISNIEIINSLENGGFCEICSNSLEKEKNA
jgi:hypothetical protein